MEQKHILLSALGVGVGVGVGLGLASGQTMSKWAGNNPSPNAVTPEKMEKELLRQIVDGRESNITFDEFPYYLRSHFIPFYLFPFLFLVLSIYLMIFSFLQYFCNFLLHGDQSSFILCSTPFLLSLLQQFTSLLFFLFLLKVRCI